MTAAGPRTMCFKLRPSGGDGSGERWRWAVYSHPDLAFLRDGQVAGDRDEAEHAARAAIANMGGTLRTPEPAHAPSGGGTDRAAGRSRPEVDDP